MVIMPMKSVASILSIIAVSLAMSTMTVLNPAFAAEETTVTRDVSDFDTIRLSGKYDGTVIVSDTEGLVMTGKGDIDSQIITEVKGNELRVRPRKGKYKRGTVTLEINAKSLEKFIIEGAGKFTIEGIDSDDFEVKLPGAASIELEGRCGDLSIVIAGAAHVDAENLICETGSVRISGTGTISVYASEEIDARVSGLGKIEVYGNPKEIDQHISGLGKIKLH
jgi:cytoskeletal protein CcmA (bactofilin family)